MVRLNALDRHRQAAPHFLDERRGRFDGVVSIDPQHAVSGGLIDGRELIEAAGAELEVLDVDLDGLPREVDLAPAAGAWAIAGQGTRGTRWRCRIGGAPLEARRAGRPARLGDTGHARCRRGSVKSRRSDRSGSHSVSLARSGGARATAPVPFGPALALWPLDSSRTSCRRGLRTSPGCPGITLLATI